MVSLKQEIMSTDNLLALPRILEQAKLVLGGSMNDEEIAGLAGFSKEVPPTSIKMGMIPIRESRHSTNLYVDEAKLPEVMGEFGLGPSYQARSNP